jgi:hypothetical protein
MRSDTYGGMPETWKAVCDAFRESAASFGTGSVGVMRAYLCEIIEARRLLKAVQNEIAPEMIQNSVMKLSRYVKPNASII